jgi:hypothetical protein
MSDAFGISEIWVCAAEMPDGALLVATRTAGVQRVTAAARQIVAAVGDWQLVGLAPAFAEVEGASTARVVALHSEGWAVALGDVAETAGGGSGGTDDVSYWPTGTTRGVELWAYADGVWTVAARGVTEAQGEAFEVVASGDDVYVLQLGGSLYGQLVWARRGRALVGRQRADWPAIVAERALFANSAGRLAGAWYGVSNTYNNVDGTGAMGAAKICQAHGRYLLPRASVEGQGLGAAGNAGALQLGLGVSDGGMVPQWTWQWGVFGADGGLQVAEVAASLDNITPGKPGALVAVSQARWGGQQSMTLEQGNGLYRIERRTRGMLVYAEVRDGVLGLVVAGCPDPSYDGFYHPDGTYNGETRYVDEDGTHWIIWDGEQWVVVAVDGDGDVQQGGYVLTLDGQDLGLEVFGTPDGTCDGQYLPGPDVNGRTSYEQVDGEHRIIWDGEKWVLVDGDGTIIYVDGSGDYPWQGVWTDPEGGTGPVVGGRAVPAAEGVAIEVQVVVEPSPVSAQMRALVRVDRQGESRTDWRTYQALEIGTVVTLDTPGAVVEVAIAKPAAMATPAVRVTVYREIE